MNIEFETDLQLALQTLRAGGVILYPTDTVWGLGCDATNAAAVEKIMEIKHRPANKSFVTLLADEKDFPKYVAVADLSIFDYLRTCAKPTTVVYENAVGLAQNVLAGDGSVAIRLVQDAFCKALIHQFGKPIVSTSANISGQPSPSFFNEITAEVKRNVDYIVQYRQLDNTPKEPSSIIKWKDGAIVFIRK